MSEIQWWEIPFIAAGLAIGSWLGNVMSVWIKRKLGWLDEGPTREQQEAERSAPEQELADDYERNEHQ